jgi:pyrrolidone-carboxylate peptidase
MRILALLLLLSSPTILAQTKKKIILSYFKPFAGRDVNHTETVAKLAKEQLGHDAEVILCPMDEENGITVAFHSGRKDVLLNGQIGKLEGKSSFDALKACLDQHPDAQQVLSLGEGTCKVQVEGVAKNVMSTGYSSRNKDNNGILIPDAEIISDKGPKYIPNDDANILALCMEQTIKNHDKFLSYSTDAGSYVCNNLMYNFQSYLDFNKLPVSFAFMHIPLTYERNEMLCGKNHSFDNSKDFSAGIASQVASFARTKIQVLNKIFPTKNGKSTFKEICANPLEDTVPSIDIAPGAIRIMKSLNDEQILLATPIKDCIRRNKVIQKAALKN